MGRASHNKQYKIFPKVTDFIISCPRIYIREETVISRLHVRAETVISRLHIREQTVISRLHIRAETVISRLHIRAETYLSTSHKSRDCYLSTSRKRRDCYLSTSHGSHSFPLKGEGTPVRTPCEKLLTVGHKIILLFSSHFTEAR